MTLGNIRRETAGAIITVAAVTYVDLMAFRSDLLVSAVLEVLRNPPPTAGPTELDCHRDFNVKVSWVLVQTCEENVKLPSHDVDIS